MSKTRLNPSSATFYPVRQNLTPPRPKWLQSCSQDNSQFEAGAFMNLILPILLMLRATPLIINPLSKPIV